MEVLCVGEALVDLNPMTAVPGGWHAGPGGSEANLAIGVARQGVGVRLIARIGSDPLGADLLRALRAEGVDVSGVARDTRRPTGLVFLHDLDADERHFTPYRVGTADTAYDPAELRRESFEGVGWVCLPMPILRTEGGRATVERAMDLAREVGAHVATDLNLRPHLWSSVDACRAAATWLAERADVVKSNDAEARLLTGTSDALEAARRLLDLGPRLVIVTRGRHGCAWAGRWGDSGVRDALPTTAVDCTGAGDAFMAGLVVGLVRAPGAIDGDDLSAALDRALHLGAAAVAVRGATAWRL